MHNNGEEIRIVLKYTADRPKGNSTRKDQTEKTFDIEKCEKQNRNRRYSKTRRSGSQKCRKNIFTVPIKTELVSDIRSEFVIRSMHNR